MADRRAGGPAPPSIDEHILDVRRLQQRPRDEAVGLGALDQALGVAARQVRADLQPQPREAEALVVGLDAHLEFAERDVTLARRVRYRQGETRGDRRQEQLRRRGSLVVAPGRRRLVSEDVEVANVDAGTVATLPASEEDLVSHDQGS